jgi:DnaJ-class molecular chaperone
MRVYNRSKEIIEPAVWRECPRCRGFGGNVTDEYYRCPLCEGKGSLWVARSGSGWTRARYARLYDSKPY